MLGYSLLKVETNQNSFSIGFLLCLEFEETLIVIGENTLPQKTGPGNQIIQACLTDSNLPVRSYCTFLLPSLFSSSSQAPWSHIQALLSFWESTA